MIASLRGTLARKAADYLIIDVSGVGYQVFAPLSTFSAMPKQGDEVVLRIHTHLREESLSLYGFALQAEKDAFLQLISVSGIGPRLALAVLSSLTVEDLVCSLRTGDDSRLCSIPGIGKKTAARLILELKDKLKSLGGETGALTAAAGGGGESAAVDDALSALVQLGYRRAQAEEALQRVLRGRPDVPVETLIREALGDLMKR